MTDSKKSINSAELVEILQGCKLVAVAKDIAAVVKMPTDTAILTMLGVVSAAVAMVYRTEYEHGGMVPIGLYVACEQPPSTGKSGLVSMMQEPIFSELKELRTQGINIAGFLTDTTPEAMEGTLSNAGGLFMLASTEQTLINSLLGLSYKDKSSNNNNSLLLEGYSGDWHSSARITRKGYIGNVHGAVTLISQDGTIDKILSSSNGTGIAERFFLFTEPDLLGKRDHLQRHIRDRSLQDDYRKAIKSLFAMVAGKNAHDRAAMAEAVGLVKNGDNDAEIQKDIDGLNVPLRALNELECLRVARASWDYINEQKNEVEIFMAGGKAYDSSLMRSYAGKLDQRVLKVASVLHVMEALLSDREVTQLVEHRYIAMAVRLARWGNRLVYEIATSKGYIGKTAEFDAVANFLAKRMRAKGSEIKQGCKGLTVFKHKREGAGRAIDATLAAMVGEKLLVTNSVMAPTGRSYSVYELV